MWVACLMLSPLLLLWLSAEACHRPTQQRLWHLKQNLWAPLARAFTYPSGKQRDAFAQFFVGIAIASCVGAATVTFETNWGAATWALYVKLTGLLIGVVIPLALASLFYGAPKGN
jgi:hypothetical protein